MRKMNRSELYFRLNTALKGVVTTRGISYSVNVFNDNTGIVQVNVSISNMRASVLACVKENDDGTWSVSDNSYTIVVDNLNQVGSTIIRMVTKIRTLRSRINT
ncbi:gp96 [Sphingomonas phage PAU]|uniref:gp96 n=1 Tax=Sphingomonas phage PAU TaxID=1150991 RepID=UPI00025731EA|nr:gp96 [Sphingomonas phage PAU]AFF28094.1 gp96 [Sphingomonas phage PAU]